MIQGESSREKATHAILSLLANPKGLRSNEIMHQLKDEFAKNTVYKYRDELASERSIELRPGNEEEKFAARYFITKKGSDILEKMRLKSEWVYYLDEMSIEQIRYFIGKFRKQGTRLKFTETDANEKLMIKNPKITGETTKTIDANACIKDKTKKHRRRAKMPRG